MRHDERSNGQRGPAVDFLPTLPVVAALVLLCASGCSPSPPSHGTSFLVALHTNQVANPAGDSNQLFQARDVLRKRFDVFGMDVFFEPMAPDRLLVKLPVMDNDKLNTAREMISKTGRLEFRMVNIDSDRLLAQGIVEPGYEVLKEQRLSRDGKKIAIPSLVRKTPELNLTGKHIRQAMVSRDRITGAPEILFEFDSTGARLFEKITTQYKPAGDRIFQLAIVLDGELMSAPRIMGVISGGRGAISGNFTVREALMLAGILENPLDAPLLILEEKTF